MRRCLYAVSAVLIVCLLGSFAAYYLFRGATALLGENRRGRLAGAFIGAWGSVFLASLACALELAISGTSPLMLVMPAMGGVHAIIGIGEGLVTVAVLSLVLTARPDLLSLQKV